MKMICFNKIMLIGYLSTDVKTQKSDSGKIYAEFKVATYEQTGSKDSPETAIRTDWHDIVVTGKTAENCNKILKKGSKVLVEGKIRNSDRSGRDYDIIASDITFI